MLRKKSIYVFLSFIILSRCATVNQNSTPPTIIQLAATATPFTLATEPEPQKFRNLSSGILPVKAVGKIIFQQPDMGPDMGLYFYDMQDGQKYIIPNTEDAFGPFVSSSPDHKKAAFFDVKSESVGIISADGSTTELNIKDKIDGIFHGWLDNKKIIFVEKSHSDGSIATLDIETGTIQEIRTNLHDVNFDAIHWYAGGSQPSVIFDFTLDKIIYLSIEVPPADQPRLGFIMRDRETQKLLWAKESSDVTAQPKWSPDSEYAAVVITNEGTGSEKIYIINRNGQEIKAIDTAFVGVTLIEWSPDGKKISFVFFNGKARLAVYDLVSDEIQQYTVHQETGRIVWSPDSKQIATAGSLVDLSTNCVFTLKPDDLFGPLAWLVK